MDKKFKRQGKKYSNNKMMSQDFKPVIYESLQEQVDGDHYKNMKIQPAEFINENDLPFAEGNAIKYICRHKKKGKIKDINKAIHYLQMIKERDYPNG